MYRLLFFLLLLTALTSCENDMQTVKDLTNRADLPIRTATTTEMIYSDSAHVKVKLLAPLLNQYIGDNPRIVMPRGVNVSFYNDSLIVTTHLTGDSAIRKEKARVMEIYRRVVVINRKGDTLRTEKLIWDENKRMIYTNVHVFIATGNGDILDGQGLEANEDFTNYKITKPTGSKITPEDKQPGKD
jgi:LPS export ABC transporter protein LptC